MCSEYARYYRSMVDPFYALNGAWGHVSIHSYVQRLLPLVHAACRGITSLHHSHGCSLLCSCLVEVLSKPSGMLAPHHGPYQPSYPPPVHMSTFNSELLPPLTFLYYSSPLLKVDVCEVFSAVGKQCPDWTYMRGLKSKRSHTETRSVHRSKYPHGEFHLLTPGWWHF